MKLKILFISHEHDRILGSTLSLCNLINSIKDQIEPIILIPQKGIVYDLFIHNGYRCITQDFEVSCFSNKINTIPLFLKFIKKLYIYKHKNKIAINKIYEQLKSENIDIIHTNTSVIDIGYFISKKMGVKHIWHLREMQDVLGLKPILGWKRFNKMVSMSNAVIFITEATKRYYKNINCKNSYILFDAVRSKKDITYSSNKEEYFLFCGSISKVKGIDKAIDIFIRFCKKNPNTKYKLKLAGPIGDRKLKEEIDETLKANNLINKVDFLGYCNNIKEYMIKSKALLMCSPNEAQGRVTIEAMFYGCAVIGYNAGGTKEIIINNKNGFLFNENEEAINLLEQIVNNQIPYDQIIENAHNYVESHFSEEIYSKHLMSIYHKL